MFKDITIKNFRGIRDLSLDNFRQINIFVGDNGTSKTTVLDAVFVLINPNNPELWFRSNLFRGIDVFDSNFFKTFFYNCENLEIELTSHIDTLRKVVCGPLFEADIPVEIKVAEKIPGTAIEKNITGIQIKFQIGNKTFESQFLQSPDSNTKILTPKFVSSKEYSEVMSGSYFNDVTLKNNDALGDLFDKVNDKKGKTEILSFLKRFDNSIEDIELDRNQRLAIRSTNFNTRIPLNAYGEGILRGLHIFLNFQLVNTEHDIVLIDEIENGLHWSKQATLWESISEIILRNKSQIFVTTHSYEMLKNLFEVAEKKNFLSEISLYRFEKQNQQLQSVHYDIEQFKYALSSDFEVR